MTPAARLLVGLVRAYQRWLSPSMGVRCRYVPSCSHYAAEAVQRHGALRGLYLAVRRLGRCHPLRPGGLDEVPDSFSLRTHATGAHCLDDTRSRA